MNFPIIRVKNLSKTYEYWKKQPGILASVKSLFHREKLYTEAVKDISFEIQEGELVGFLGPNGAGKTTILKILSGILHPTNGEIKVLGHIPWKREGECTQIVSKILAEFPVDDILIDEPDVEEVVRKIFVAV